MKFFRQSESKQSDYENELKQLVKKKKQLLTEGLILQAEGVERELQSLREKRSSFH